MAKDAFAARLKEAMARLDLKQVDLVRAAEAQGVKLGKSHISQYVAGKTVPRADTLRFLAQELGVGEEWLMGGGACPQPPAAEDVHPDAGQWRPAEDDGAKGPDTQGRGTMREFKKSSKLDNVLYDVRGPVVDEAARMEDEGEHILKLNIGNPAPVRFPHARRGHLRHAPAAAPTARATPTRRGLFSARKAIMQYAQLKGMPNVTIDDIYTGNGVSELINLSMYGAARQRRRGARSQSPDYPLWTACATLAGGQARPLSSATSRRTGTPTWTTCAVQDHDRDQGHRHHQPQQPHRRALSRARCSSRSSRSPASTS